MNTQTVGNNQLEEALHFVNWMMADTILRRISNFDTGNSLGGSQQKQKENNQVEFLNLKNKQTLISKIPVHDKEQDEYQGKKDKKIVKKQTTISKKKSKLEKPNIRNDSKLEKYSSVTPITTTHNISLKMLLNDQVPMKIYQSSAEWQAGGSRSGKSSSSFKSSNTWKSPNRSESKLEGNFDSPKSPINQFNNEQQIQIVRHHNFRAFNNSQDIIDRMEELKASRTSKKEDRKIDDVHKQVVESSKIIANSNQVKKKALELDDLYFHSVGNKYMRKIVENYAHQGSQLVK